jgi:hypothetical protein
MGVNGWRVYYRGHDAHAALMRAPGAGGYAHGVDGIAGRSARHVRCTAADPAGDDGGIAAASTVVDAVGIVVHCNIFVWIGMLYAARSANNYLCRKEQQLLDEEVEENDGVVSQS